MPKRIRLETGPGPSSLDPTADEARAVDINNVDTLGMSHQINTADDARLKKELELKERLEQLEKTLLQCEHVDAPEQKLSIINQYLRNRVNELEHKLTETRLNEERLTLNLERMDRRVYELKQRLNRVDGRISQLDSNQEGEEADLTRMDIISKVPYELALYIMSFLQPQDLCNAAQTCRSWRIVCEDTRLWRERCIEEGLLSDEQTYDALFKGRISKHHRLQNSLANDQLFHTKHQPNQWKVAYLRHISVIRNWTSRKFNIPGPFIVSSVNGNDTTSKKGGNTQAPRLDSPPSAATPAKPDKLMQLRCHEDSVITCLQFNPDTNIIVSGSDDQTLKVWSSETGRCITTLEGHTGGVWSSQLSPEDIVVSGSTDRTLRVWNAYSGELYHTLYGHSSTVRCLALDGDRVVSGSRDMTLRLWDVKQGRCLYVFMGHNGAVRCVEFKNNTIVSGAYDHMIMVWDAETGSMRHALECHISRIYSLQFDGKTIASGSLDASICIWSADSGELKHHLRGHTSLTSKMQLRGDILVSANADSYCKVWDVNTGQCLQTLGGDNKHSSAITSVYFNSRHVVTSSDDGTVKLWDIKTGQFLRNLVVLPTASQGGVVWRIRASYSKLICAVGSRTQTEDTHLLVLDFNE